jgi:hypothetical protein
MNYRIRILVAAAAVSVFGASAPAFAKLTDAEIARLGADLTPVGAEKAGNKDGTIPEWSGGLCAPPAGWTASKGGYADPFVGDKVLFTITKANAAQYKDKLTPGLLALLNKYANFSMPVYATRRTACYPQQIYDTVKAEAGKIDIAGWGISGRSRTTVPFPIPKSGLEVIWNHPLRYIGGGIDRLFNQFPVRPSGDYYTIESQEYRIFNQNLEPPQDNLLLVYESKNLSPASLAGNVILVHEPVDQIKEGRSAWQYNAGSRRVRRAPELGYDNIGDASDGLRTFDQFDMYNGAPDRYDWNLVGKKEVYVPYNLYKLGDKSLKYKDLIQKNVLKSDVMRYELHRVWVVEANLKPGMKHIYAKRVFYLDEDSWSVVYEDAYDTRKELWRVGFGGMIQFYDQKVPWYRVNMWHDLNSGAYLVSLLDNEIKEPWSFGLKGKWSDFQPDMLRRAGTK